MSIDQIKTVAVLGAGTMGNGIAHVFARAGFQVILRDVEKRFLERGIETIGKNLDREIKKGKLAEGEKAAVLGRVQCVTDMGAIGAADFVVEAVSEKIEIKRAVLTEADGILRPEVILASNTSSIAMTTLAAMTKTGGPVCGDALHESGAGDGAGGGDSGAADERCDVFGDDGAGEEAGEDAGGGE